MNKLTVYSNGVSRLQKKVAVNGKTSLSFPVRKNLIADVLATLGIYGNVKVVEPPSYNNNANLNSLTLSPNDVRQQLFTKLSGAEVEVTAKGVTHKGKVVGVQSRQILAGETNVAESRDFLILTDTGVVSVSEEDLLKFQFTQPEVQRLVESALAKNFQQVRPDSVLLDLVLAPLQGEATIAEVEYALPTAAWQSVYQLKLMKDKTLLEVRAKVDNPTDEDWPETQVTVVVGDPISFDTDLGEIRVPKRSKVNLVSDQAAGPIRTQEARRTPMRAYAATTKSAAFALCSAAPAGGGGFEALNDCDEGSELESVGCGMAPAVQSEASSEEVGDFAVFTSKDINDIRANRSAIVNLFTKEIEGREILFFDSKQDSTRAYRGVRLKNTTDNTLGKGVCTVYLKDILAGQAVFKTVKPGKEQSLVFSRENGVNVDLSESVRASQRVAIGLSNGQFWWKQRNVKVSNYTFDNLRKDEDFEVEINHTKSFRTPVYEVDGATQEDTSTGLLLKGKLSADGSLVVTVKETEVTSMTQGFYNGGNAAYNQFASLFLSDECLAAKVRESKGFKLVENALADLQKVNKDLAEIQEESKKLKEEQERLLKLTKGNTTATSLDKWQRKLDAGEDRISQIEQTELPKLREHVAAKDALLAEALKALAFSWDDGTDCAKQTK